VFEVTVDVREWNSTMGSLYTDEQSGVDDLLSADATPIVFEEDKSTLDETRCFTVSSAGCRILLPSSLLCVDLSILELLDFSFAFTVLFGLRVDSLFDMFWGLMSRGSVSFVGIKDILSCSTLCGSIYSVIFCGL
jgi:hypothetical protein